ncbi:hypothetical protein B0E45_05175 [Sinorhizobium sp. A49]|nr:hypothetical protein B0E45_05175 [Sinorhizobium sp. A49]
MIFWGWGLSAVEAVTVARRLTVMAAVAEPAVMANFGQMLFTAPLRLISQAAGVAMVALVGLRRGALAQAAAAVTAAMVCRCGTVQV